jgi:putative endonuclease
MKRFTSETQKIGQIGEDIACKFLIKQGFVIIERNYTRKYGEIDIVAEKQGRVHFVEVKSVSRENLDSVTHETEGYRPEDNMHPWKLKRLSRVIQAYLLHKHIDGEWQLDLASVYINMKDRKARVNMFNDIVL